MGEGIPNVLQELFDESSKRGCCGNLGASQVWERSLGALAVNWAWAVCVFLHLELKITFQKAVLHFGDFYPIYLCHLETNLTVNFHIPIYLCHLETNLTMDFRVLHVYFTSNFLLQRPS